MTLEELTGQESGIVVFGNTTREAIVCNWAGINGLPRLFATGLIGLGDLSDAMLAADPRPVDDVGLALEGAQIIYDENGEAEGLAGMRGTLWEFDDQSGTPVEIYAPEGWA